jgi:hypothetical protein
MVFHVQFVANLSQRFASLPRLGLDMARCSSPSLQDDLRIVALEPLGRGQAVTPLLDCLAAGHALHQPRPIRLVHVVEAMPFQPICHHDIVTAAFGTFRFGLPHSKFAAKGQSFADQHPIRPRRTLPVTLPRLLRPLDDVAVALGYRLVLAQPMFDSRGALARGEHDRLQTSRRETPEPAFRGDAALNAPDYGPCQGMTPRV